MNNPHSYTLIHHIPRETPLRNDFTNHALRELEKFRENFID